MNDIAKHQHFVPQFYLRQFADDKEKLFVFDKPQGEVFASSTDDVAVSKHFYDVDQSFLPEGADPQFVERNLAAVLVEVGTNHRLTESEPVGEILRACEGTIRE